MESLYEERKRKSALEKRLRSLPMISVIFSPKALLQCRNMGQISIWDPEKKELINWGLLFLPPQERTVTSSLAIIRPSPLHNEIKVYKYINIKIMTNISSSSVSSLVSKEN